MIAVAVCAFALPANADDVTPAAHALAAKRGVQSLTLPSAAGAASIGNGRSSTSFANGFVYLPDSTVNIGGRLKVGKSHVYVPYYGNVSSDPAHPSWQGVAGIAYGFRTWDISVVNGGFGSAPAAVPGSDIPKPNQSLTLSIRF